MAKVDLADEIMAMIPPSNRSRPWWERVATEHQKTLDAIAEGWRAGKYGTVKQRAAKAISAWLNAKGISTVKHLGVVTWLDRLTS
jgi:hypothetical protein